MHDQRGLHGSTEELARAGQDENVTPHTPESGSLRSALANVVVGLMKKHYGRGPTAAKAWLLDDYVFIATEDGLTRSEETLLTDGKEDEIRRYRLSFQETVGPTLTRAVSELTGRRVLTYHSQIVFCPTRCFEIFVLEPQSER